MKTPDSLHVDLAERSYEIRLGHGLLDQTGDWCAGLTRSRKTLVVTDENVAPLYLERVLDSLRASGFESSARILPAGEETKCAARLAEIWEDAVTARLDRRSLLIALGGGVTGDLAGFAAASYLRGIDFLQVPTSLLAMVDSSVGGKTGINLPQGKNLVGAFHQPRAVLADLDVLSTLPPREFSAGLAEVVKYGLIRDVELHGLLREGISGLRNLDPALLRTSVRRSCEIKAEVVALDEREQDLRAILNFGHTLGHAIENVSGYGEILHGEAIAIGMIFACRVSERITGLDPAFTREVAGLLRAAELPVDWTGMDWAELLRAMTVDKKAEDAVPRFVLLEEPGKAGLPVRVPAETLKEVFEAGPA
jgi:3-dehydroquinate synthase